MMCSYYCLSFPGEELGDTGMVGDPDHPSSYLEFHAVYTTWCCSVRGLTWLPLMGCED